MPSGLSRWDVTSQQYRISLSLPSPVPFLRRLLKKHYIAEWQNHLLNSGLSGKYSVSLYVPTQQEKTFRFTTNGTLRNSKLKKKKHLAFCL
jgi:hypothetical protein